MPPWLGEKNAQSSGQSAISISVPGFYGWKLVSVLWLLDLCNMGIPFFAGAVINSAMLRQIPMSRSTFGLGFTLLNLFVGLPSLAIARSIERCGVRATFIFGSSMIFAGSLWLAFLTFHPWQYLIGYGVLIGTGMGFGTNVPLATAISRWFRRYRGRAMAIALTASGVGGFISSPVIGRVVTKSAAGFRSGWAVVACVSVAAILIAHRFIRESPEVLGQVPDGMQVDAESPVPVGWPCVIQHVWTAGEAFRTPAYWLIVVGSIACQYPIFFLVAHWILYLRGNGMTLAAATWVMSVFTISNVLGRLIGGWLTDMIAGRYAFALGLSSCLLATLWTLAQPGGYLAPFGIAALFGMGFGSSFVCMNTITGNYYSHSAVPMLNGVMMLLSGLVCAPAGFVGGRLFDKYGSYVPALEVNLLILIAGMVAVILARMPRERQSSRRSMRWFEHPKIAMTLSELAAACRHRGPGDPQKP